VQIESEGLVVGDRVQGLLFLPPDLVGEPGGRARRRLDTGGLGRINQHADGNPAEHIRIRIMR